MPADTNANGDMFGGWLLAQMDLAGSVIATQTAKSRVATVGIQAMSFERPVYVGDEVSCYTRLEKIGHTSMTIRIETWARRARLNETVKVTEGLFTYVAINDERKPIPVIRPENERNGK